MMASMRVNITLSKQEAVAIQKGAKAEKVEKTSLASLVRRGLGLPDIHGGRRKGSGRRPKVAK